MDDTTGSIRSNGWAPPSASHLRRGLESVFGDQGLKSVVRREANPNEAYYPSEVLTCRFHTGPERRLLLKYAPDPNEMYGGHLTGPENEQLVYDHVLTRPRCSVPAFYGCYRDPLTNALWSVAEYIEGGECLGRMHPQARWMGLAARWVGAFHATGQDSDSPGERPPLQRYDAPFYRQWAVSTAAFEGDRRAWLTELVGRYDRVVERLLAQPQVVVHGDYFWDNIVVREGTVFPVDWERGAVGVGEIDLATLIVGWETQPDVVAACRQEYQAARWSGEVSKDFERTLDNALLHVLFMLLGEDATLPNRETRNWRLDLLRSAGERVGLI